MAFPLLLQVGAVPFVTSENGIFARRNQINRSNQPRSQAINSPNNNHQSQTSSVILSRQQRAVIGQLMSEAAEAINDIIRQPETASICAQTDLSVPPNTPIITSTTFDFPENPELLQETTSESNITISQVLSSSSSEDEGSDSTPSRPVRKRRRPPSFKKQHRVVPKKNLSEADDEATSAEENSSDSLDNLELKLKLGLLCESRDPSFSGTSSAECEAESDLEKDDSVEKWSKIGEELRIIADKFGAPPELESGSDLVNPFQVNDLLSIINLMLPVSVPSSMWSALLSYAAWKIFKKFQ